MGASAIHGAVAAAAAATAFAAAGAPGVSPAFAPGDTLCGFRVVSVCELPDVEGRLVRMVYEKKLSSDVKLISKSVADNR